MRHPLPRRYHEALDAYGAAIAEAPAVASLYGNRAAALLMLRRYPEARRPASRHHRGWRRCRPAQRGCLGHTLARLGYPDNGL